MSDRIEALQLTREQLRARIERKRDRHESRADLEAKNRSATLAQLRAQLREERRRYRSISVFGRGVGSRRQAAKAKAETIAKQIEAQSA